MKRARLRTCLRRQAAQLIVTVLVCASPALAQTSWWRTYGGTNDDRGYSVQQTADGGYVIAGRTASFGAGHDDVYLIKTDASGDTLWTRTYGGTYGDAGYSVQQTTDGGYVIAGRIESFSGGEFVYLIKTDASGDTLWTRTYGGGSYDEGYSVQQTSDDGCIIAGYTRSFGAGGFDVYLIRTNASGDTLWTRTYGGTNDDFGESVRQTADSGYVIAGRTASFGAGDFDAYLIRTDASGDTLWTRTYGGTDYDEGCSVQPTADGGYIVTGYTGSYGAGHGDVYLVKTNSSGDTLWTRTYGGTLEDNGLSVLQTSDSGYIISGHAASFGAGYYDVYLIKTDASGNKLWTRTYGGTNFDGGCSVQRTADGGYVIAGRTESFGAGDNDVFLIKTDSLGNVGAVEESPKPQAMRGRLGTTVLSGASGVRRLASSVVYDVMGRRVLHAKPGIYFLRTEAADLPHKVLLVW